MPNPDTGENFPIIFKWWGVSAFRTLPEGYEETDFNKVVCSVCGVLWALIGVVSSTTNWVCPDPNCRRAKYFRETIERFEKVMSRSE